MNYLEPPQIVTRAGELVDDSTMLGVKAYAEHVKAGERTVRTWLADGRLASAVKLDGAWMIRASDRPGEPAAAGAGDELVPAVRQAVQHMPQSSPWGLSHELELAPAFLELDAAARLLGIPAGAIRRHRDYFELVPFGERGRLVMPAAKVREIAGLA